MISSTFHHSVTLATIYAHSTSVYLWVLDVLCYHHRHNIFSFTPTTLHVTTLEIFRNNHFTYLVINNLVQLTIKLSFANTDLNQYSSIFLKNIIIFANLGYIGGGKYVRMTITVYNYWKNITHHVCSGRKVRNDVRLLHDALSEIHYLNGFSFVSLLACQEVKRRTE